MSIQQFAVCVTSGLDTLDQRTKFEAQQSGVTMPLSNTASNTSSGRMQALAAANAGFNLKQGADALQAGQGDANSQVPTGNKNPDGTPEMKDANVADKAGGNGISLSVGSSSSQPDFDSSRT